MANSYIENPKTNARIVSLLRITLLVMGFISSVSAQPTPVRNDVPRLGQQEVIMMRHAYLDKGAYAHWYEQSSTKVWPWYERLGARIIGDFEIFYPEGEDATPSQDEAIRFARYASYEHRQSTRPTTSQSVGATGGSARLAGDGPLFDANNEGLDSRREVSKGSRGGVFLQGYMAPARPVFMPGLGERYEPANNQGSNGAIAVRLDRARPGGQVLILEYRKIRKGSFEEFHAIYSQQLYPYLEKIGVRPVGQWQVAYFPLGDGVESDQYDEVYTLNRYASYDHYVAVRDSAISMGGNGPDYQMGMGALSDLDELTRETNIEFLRGEPFGSPPQFTPGTGETFRQID